MAELQNNDTTSVAPEGPLVAELHPASEAAPTSETTSAPEATPASETAQAPEATPALEATPAPEATPASEVTPAPETAPAVEAASIPDNSAQSDSLSAPDGQVDGPTPPKADADATQAAPDASGDDTIETTERPPPVVREIVQPEELDVDHPTINRDVLEDAYHTTVETIQDQQTAPEQVAYTIAPVQETTFDERDEQAERDHLAQEAAQFKDTREVLETVHTAAQAPTMIGEHHHYHIHERVQPVIQRQVVQPTVVHTTVPVHETIHKSAHFTQPTKLAPVSLADFQAAGGQLEGLDAQETKYAGKPRNADAFNN